MDGFLLSSGAALCSDGLVVFSPFSSFLLRRPFDGIQFDNSNDCPVAGKTAERETVHVERGLHRSKECRTRSSALDCRREWRSTPFSSKRSGWEGRTFPRRSSFAFFFFFLFQFKREELDRWPGFRYNRMLLRKSCLQERRRMKSPHSICIDLQHEFLYCALYTI